MIEILLVIIIVILLGPWLLPIFLSLLALAATPFIFLLAILFEKAEVKKVTITKKTTKDIEP